MKLGLIAFANDGGLGAQTRRLADFLQPDKILVIDSTPFSKNKQLHSNWYPPEKTMITKGFPRNFDCLKFIDGLTHVFTVENPYNFYLVKACQERGIKVICQTNYEFCENLSSPWLPVPDVFAMPSHWKVAEMEKLFPGRVVYLPPPIDPKEFEPALNSNFKRWVGEKTKKRFLHIVGTLAWEDRNGTLDLMKALPYCKEDFELVIKAQHPLPAEYDTSDPRVKTFIGSTFSNDELYHDFDAMILPRRYGGLSLSTNEALMSGLPVMMTAIPPNNEWLPIEWLVPSHYVTTFPARVPIEVYSADIIPLAMKIDYWAVNEIPVGHNLEDLVNEFRPEVLRPQYDALFV